MRLNRISVISLLAEKDMQRKDLAEKTGISRNTISAVCNGKSCSAATAQKISRALGVDVESIINK
jgi:putative transcriptional regulator